MALNSSFSCFEEYPLWKKEFDSEDMDIIFDRQIGSRYFVTAKNAAKVHFIVDFIKKDAIYPETINFFDKT